MSPATKMSENSPQQDLLPMELPLMSSPGASRAKTFPSLADALASKVRDLVCGANTGASLANFDPASSSWRTFQACLVSGWEPFSETFPRSGMMRSGTVYQLQPSAPITGEIGSGLWRTPTAGDERACTTGTQNQTMLAHQVLLPTPSATSYGSNRGGAMGRVGPARHSLESMARHGLWPTPRAHDARADFAKLERSNTGMSLETAARLWPTPTSLSPAKDGNNEAGNSCGLVAIRKRILDENPQATGSLNPQWVAWLMGYPTEWLSLEPSATPSSRRSRK